jgi:hypothetical protein
MKLTLLGIILILLVTFIATKRLNKNLWKIIEYQMGHSLDYYNAFKKHIDKLLKYL